jgi:predicted DNA-binding protein (UPF0251 family)
MKLRYVSQLPSVSLFRPIGIAANVLQSVCLLVEEVEAIRLKDLKGLEQEECAKKMRVSRATFHHILESARKKLAQALINGKAIEIEGGNFGLPQTHFKCKKDGHEWSVPFDVLANRIPLICPICFGNNIIPLSPFGCRRRFHGGRR